MYNLIKTSFTAFLALLILLHSSCTEQQTEFYVATDGNDNGTGTIEQPFASLEKARYAIRKARQEVKNVAFSIFLREGAYSLSKSFVMQAEDGGTKENPLRISAYGDGWAST